jgi:putative transcriptional regulator
MDGTLKGAYMAEAFKSIKQGLNEAIAHARSKSGTAESVKLYQPQAVDVSSLRGRLNLTQEQFAARFGFSVATLRHWERGDRSPSGASLVLLNVIERNPAAVLQALQ